MDIESEGPNLEASTRDLAEAGSCPHLRPSDGQFAPAQVFLCRLISTPPNCWLPEKTVFRFGSGRAGKKRVQTIKTVNRGASLGRGEWEHKLQVPIEPDLRAARGTALEPLLSGKLKRNLEPIVRHACPSAPFAASFGNSRSNWRSTRDMSVPVKSRLRWRKSEPRAQEGHGLPISSRQRVGSPAWPPINWRSRVSPNNGYDLIADQPPRAFMAQGLF